MWRIYSREMRTNHVARIQGQTFPLKYVVHTNKFRKDLFLTK